MVILISQDTSAVGLLVHGYININSPTADVSSDINITMD
jgi:hypothetical protein